MDAQDEADKIYEIPPSPPLIKPRIQTQSLESLRQILWSFVCECQVLIQLYNPAIHLELIKDHLDSVRPSFLSKMERWKLTHKCCWYVCECVKHCKMGEGKEKKIAKFSCNNFSLYMWDERWGLIFVSRGIKIIYTIFLQHQKCDLLCAHLLYKVKVERVEVFFIRKSVRA